MFFLNKSADYKLKGEICHTSEKSEDYG